MNELAVIEQRAVTSYSVTEVMAQVHQVHTLMKEGMKEGTHYGSAFEGDDKKNLLKPGADKLMFMFRLRPDFTQEIKDLPNGHREIITRCMVFHIESGNKIAEGVGSASTLESKYRYRNMARKCPHCGKEAIIKGKKEYGGGWVCFKKKDGCGAKFEEGDPAIVNQQAGKIENPDIADCYNTVLKISKKRAYVDATITATAASDIFTQDLEDLDKENGNGKNGNENGNERNVTPENGEKLANEAAREQRENNSGTKPQKADPERKSVFDSIGSIMMSANPDKLFYFTDEEKQEEWDKAKNADLTLLKNQHNRLKKELEKRVAAHKPIPFEDNTPAMYTVKEPDDEFSNDIPEGMYPEKTANDGNLDIF
jgi:hypothetical protein